MKAAPSPLGGLRALRIVGPGLVVAATGVGAGDLVAATKAGATYGIPLLWTAAAGALLKFCLAEGVARWQLATGTTLLEGWVRFLGRGFSVSFLVFLLIWTAAVAAALMSACGLAAHALVPSIPLAAWAVLHALAGLLFVWCGDYSPFETVMKWVVGLMFVCIIGSAIFEFPSPGTALQGFRLALPAGSVVLVLGILGGVGGTVTLLSYNYWLRDKGWTGPRWAGVVRIDLAVGYGITGLFGVAILLLSGIVLLPRGVVVEGSGGVLQMAAILGGTLGQLGQFVFLVGFWGAVVSSLLGVWQSVPHLFTDYWRLLRGKGALAAGEARQTRTYRGYALGMTVLPMGLLWLGRPVWLVVAYAAFGALFMPFLAASLLVLNNRRTDLGALRNGPLANLALGLCLLLFTWLAIQDLREEFASRWQPQTSRQTMQGG